MDVHVLAIETSCDETACAVVRNGRHMLSNVIWSQVGLFGKYGGVVPEIASRKHMEYLIPAMRRALSDAEMTLEEMDLIAVTSGPGLVGALLVGVSAAKGIAFALGKPLLGIHHLEAHVAANYLTHHGLEPPFLCLLVSGGHSHLMRVDSFTRRKVLGKTLDDAAGEAYDKVARALGLGYPGGPAIDRLAAAGDPDAISFPRARMKDRPYDFSFSGLKTAVLGYLNGQKKANMTWNAENVCAGFQKAVVETLVDNTMRAARDTGMRTVVLAGGVAANRELREKMGEQCRKEGYSLYYPIVNLCTDNAAMVASAAFYRYREGERAGLSLNAVSSPDL